MMRKLTRTPTKYPISHERISFAFRGKIIDSKDLQSHDFLNQKVTIIGADQFTVSQLSLICKVATSVTVFQIKPEYILPKTEKIFQRLLHPLLIKQQKFLSQRIKSIISLRFLEAKVFNLWLKSQLIPNIANTPKRFLKSDDYYTALQEKNCQLITWPIKDILSNAIITLNGTTYPTDIIILTDYKSD